MKNNNDRFAMYTQDSETGRERLQIVKENLYEAATKVVLHTIEMYTKQPLGEWAKKELVNKIDTLDKIPVKLKENREELAQGRIGCVDITNGIYVLNSFVRKPALKEAQDSIQAKIQILAKQKELLEDKQFVIRNRIKELMNPSYEVTYPSVTTGNDMDDEDSFSELTEFDSFKQSIADTEDIESLKQTDENLDEKIKGVAKSIKDLENLQSGRRNLLKEQDDLELVTLDGLRRERNSKYGHDTNDDDEVTLVGKWKPDAGPLYEWASNILKYVKAIELRYQMYAAFDDFYAQKEFKEKFDACKVYVQKQISELYVNHSSTVLEFAGDLYAKGDEERGFDSLIEAMAQNWNTGIRYLTVVTNDDMPEFNTFFKDCLSGTSLYVDSYLVDRNEIRAAYRKKGDNDADYLYFRLLYHLNPSMRNIYWKNKIYDCSEKKFEDFVLYKALKAKNMFAFKNRFENPEQYFDGIDLKKWCEYHLLSEAYYSDSDVRGRKLAQVAENAVIAFFEGKTIDGSFSENLYKKAIYALANLYFYMSGKNVFSYTRENRAKETLHWYSLDDVKAYLENSNNFDSFKDLYHFETEIFNSPFYNAWIRQVSKELKRGDA